MTKEETIMSNGDGIKLKILRNNMSLSVSEFSIKTNINPSFINLLEKGCLPLSKRDKRKIGEAFGLQENWIEEIESSTYKEGSEAKALNKNTCKSKLADDYSANRKEEKQDCRKKLVINSGSTLKSTRIILGLSRKDVAEAIGITSVQIGYIETGKRTLTENVKLKLNNYFNENPDHLHTVLVESSDTTNSIFVNADQVAEKNIYNIENDEILERIRMIKKECGYTQSVISDKSGVNRSQLSMIESGKMRISKKVKVKLLKFISSELEANNNILDNNFCHKIISGSSVNNVPLDSKNIKGLIPINVADNKVELLKVIQSMKKTRDELQNNITILERAMNNMEI